MPLALVAKKHTKNNFVLLRQRWHWPSLHVPVSQIGESQDTAIKSVLFFIKSVCFSPAGGGQHFIILFSTFPLFSVFCFPPPSSSSLPVCLLLYLHFYKLLNWPICSSGSSLRVAGFRPRVHLSISRNLSKRNLRSSVSISQYLHAYLVHRLMLIFQRYMCKYRLDFHKYSTALKSTTCMFTCCTV